MHLVQNVINKLQKPDKLNVIAVIEHQADLINRIAQCTQHNFFLHPLNQISITNKAPNVYYNMNGEKAFDAVLCFNRLNGFNVASRLSAAYNLPLLVIDECSSNTLTPHPVGSTLNGDIERSKLVFHNGDVTIALADNIERSWINNSTLYSDVIPIPPQVLLNMTPTKVLVDPGLDDNYLDSINANKNIITKNVMEAGIYVHLLKSVTPLFIDCLFSKIPILTFRSYDLEPYIEKQCCMVLEDTSILSTQNLVEQVLAHKDIEKIKKNGYDFVAQYDNKTIYERWACVFDYLKQIFYVRG